MSIYISGPMSGYEGFNHAAFHAAEAAIRYGEVCDCEIGDDHDATGEGQ